MPPPPSWFHFNRTFDIIDTHYETAPVFLRTMSILASAETGLRAEPDLVEVDVDVVVND
ncbi:hypothetical protein FIBSPDRAFT_1049934 [Athelia psychrophila]|uniref:Uncharacterized protein n=1 Tax=Athelia psychrophila TaxID=1759441 RepID=A0A166BIH4_9AGAM|nr:hypothetical protein FIBSPDRAFT_1049934 [Fibularhizoctonia sp. CBS 109695]